ncbi:glycoside hydrolase family 13 protein [Arthrobacter sp. 35/47]|uniref:glycoside hydrolase family 13 protein n=1 Tax=Arthrobacter sp. 35/47 TaxID=269454 RepID=UPI0004B06E3D|nr:glycoside hydrolase family 13 protein [Arthrobacter sp. 35/47]
MFAQPHHDGSALYVPFPPALGSPVPVRLRVPQSYGPVLRVFVRSLRDAEPHYDEAVLLFSGDGSGAVSGAGALVCAGAWDWWEASLQLVNPVTQYRFLLEVASSDGSSEGSSWQWLNAEGLFFRDTADVHDFRLVTHEPAPEWARRGVIYQIFPDRFARSARAASRALPEWAVECTWDTPVQPAGADTPYQFYGGDLDGITERLDHISSLGATVVYLTPFFPARSNHRYDASTFTSVDPLLGGDEALIRLVEAAHARGLKVIGDLTTNHTGDAHEWFQAASLDPASEEAGFYYFSENGSDYAAWFGVPSLPKLNWLSPALRERFIGGPSSVVARFLQPPFNLDGWRIDVANMTGRHGAVDLNRSVASAVRSTMRDVNPDTLLLAESTNDAALDFGGDTWHGAMTYSNFTRPLWQWLAGSAADRVNFFGTPLPGPNRIPAEQFVELHSVFAAAFPWQVRTQNMIALNTHDTARAATVMIPGGQLVGLGILFSMPGIPTLFAGDEFGLQGVNGEDSRTPMPWDSLSREHHDLYDAAAHLGRLRRDVPALAFGGLRWLYAQGDVLAYIREHASGSVLVVACRSGFDDVTLPLDSVGVEAPDSAVDLWGTGCIAAEWELVAGSDAGSGAGSVSFRGDGPGVRLWLVPGVVGPPVPDPS